MYGRIDPAGFHAASGVVFAIAILASIFRSIARWQRFRRWFVDDYFFFFSIITLIGGTTLLYINIPLAYRQELITTGALPTPADFIDEIIADERTQFASSTLIGTTIVAVKFSFLSFFYLLIENTTPWYKIWWIVVLLTTIASAPFVMFSDFIACPYTGADILTQCVTAAAQQREIAVVKASVALDIISDVLIISIPVIILWNVQMDIRKKLILAASLCMGIFMIACACIRIAMANLPDGQIDVLWTLLWQQLEACVAVIVVSLTAFRMLFTTTIRSSYENPLGRKGNPTRRERYESQGRLEQAPRGASVREKNLVGDNTGVLRDQRDSTQSLAEHELERVKCESLG